MRGDGASEKGGDGENGNERSVFRLLAVSCWPLPLLEDLVTGEWTRKEREEKSSMFNIQYRTPNIQ